MEFHQERQMAQKAIDDASREGMRLLEMSLVHKALKLPIDKGESKRQFYEVTVWLEGPPEQLAGVRSVDYQLHPTFKPSTVSRTTPPDFTLRLKIWGGFTIKARVNFTDGTSINLVRFLALPR